MLTEKKAHEHPAYDDSLRTAADRAARSPGECFTVYWDGEAVYVRLTAALPPPNSTVVCIAQRWDANTVQLRFAGARSEWVKI